MAATDSAGVPWQGRHFEPNPHADDDGSASPRFVAAIERFRADSDATGVVDAVRESRFLIPLIAELGEAGESEHGHLIDKSQELSVVTVAGPDGRNVLPVFSCVDAMRAWDAAARPVPADGIRVALAAAAEHTDLVVIDPGAGSEFVLRRPALWSVAQERPWAPPHMDASVRERFAASVTDEPAVAELALDAGDPQSRLAGPELVVRLALRPGLDQAALDALLGRLQQRWAVDEVIAERVDSMALRLTVAG